MASFVTHYGQSKRINTKDKEKEVHMVTKGPSKTESTKLSSIQKIKEKSGISKKSVEYHQLPMPVAQLHPILLKGCVITPVEPKPITNLPEDYDPSKTFKFHCDSLGHSLEYCHLLRHRIQYLIGNGAIVFQNIAPS